MKLTYRVAVTIDVEMDTEKPMTARVIAIGCDRIDLIRNEMEAKDV